MAVVITWPVVVPGRQKLVASLVGKFCWGDWWWFHVGWGVGEVVEVLAYAADPPWLIDVFRKITRAKHGEKLNFGRGGAKNKKTQRPSKNGQNKNLMSYFSANFGEVFVKQS